MSATPPVRSVVGDRDDADDDDGVAHVWESREVRWSALAGLLLVVGFVAGRFDAPDVAVTGLYVVATLAGLRFFALEAVKELVHERVIGIELLMTVGTARCRRARASGTRRPRWRSCTRSPKRSRSSPRTAPATPSAR